jgi:hypothetical protein
LQKTLKNWLHKINLNNFNVSTAPVYFCNGAFLFVANLFTLRFCSNEALCNHNKNIFINALILWFLPLHLIFKNTLHMLENLFNLIKDQGAESVINNPEVPNEKNDAVIADATHAVAEGLQGELAGGGLQSVLSLFNGGNANAGGMSGLLNNPIVSNIIGSFTNKLTNNHGIAGNQASNIASSLIPSVISSLVNKTNNPNDSSFDLNGIIGSLTGGGQGQQAGGFDIAGLVGKFTSGGLDTDGDGQVEISDIISKVTGGAQQQQAGGGGLMDMIKGFMK